MLCEQVVVLCEQVLGAGSCEMMDGRERMTCDHVVIEGLELMICDRVMMTWVFERMIGDRVIVIYDHEVVIYR